MWEEVYSPGGVRTLGGNWYARGKPDSRLGGGRTRAERTRNMDCMVVTLEVSQLDMSALIFFKS